MGTMNKITREQLLKGGIAGAASVAALPFASSVALASDDETAAVHVHGRVTGSAGSFEINVDAAGRTHALSGSGWDTNDVNSSNQSSACIYAQQGEVSGRTITLQGAVMFAQEPSFVGALVKTEANLKTGHIKWIFGPFAFEGDGVVVKTD
jgi:hypothetical protein